MEDSIVVATTDAALAVSLAEEITAAGYVHRRVSDGADAVAIVRGCGPALVILDTALSDMDGFEACRQLRAESAVPVILVSERDDVLDRIVGFEVGADDYVVKPASMRELLCRVRAVLHRTWLCPERDLGARPVRFGQIHVDPSRRHVTRADRVIHLWPRAYDLLWFLVRNPRRTFARRELLAYVWGPASYALPGAVDAQIFHLRHNLEEDLNRPRYLRSVKGRGYRFDP